MAYVRSLVNRSSENFHVLSRFVPRDRIEDFCAVYAFCRWADDLGDEAGSTARASELLRWWGDELAACFAGRAKHPVFVALRGVVQKRELSARPFEDLLSAFRQDQVVTRYETWAQVLDYCTRSADPVGRLVLGVCGYRGAERERRSDATCTALQLVNFWQDVRRDILERDRVYIPRDLAKSHGIELEALTEIVRRGGTGGATFDGNYAALVKDLCERTAPLFATGRGLWPLLGGEARGMVKLFTLGGESVLKGIELVGYLTYLRRPKVGKLTKATLLARVWVGNMIGGRGTAAEGEQR